MDGLTISMLKAEGMNRRVLESLSLNASCVCCYGVGLSCALSVSFG